MDTTSQPWLRRGPLARESLETEDGREEFPSRCGVGTVHQSFPELGSEAGVAASQGHPAALPCGTA